MSSYNAKWNVVMLDEKLNFDETHIVKKVDPIIVKY